MSLLRYWLKARLAWLRVPILDGPLRGAWIGLFCGVRFIRGRYDRSAVDLLLAHVAPGSVMYDIGAHVGYLTLVAAGRVGRTGRVVAFEPLPLNQRYLRGHLRANRVENVDVVGACVSDRGGHLAFQRGGGTGRGRLVPDSAGTMPAVSIDQEIAAGRLRPPQFIKMDVEGAELLALHGARRTLLQHRPGILLSVHSAALREQCSAWLSEQGYAIAAGSKPGELLAQPRG